jgi:hypothetical protein
LTAAVAALAATAVFSACGGGDEESTASPVETGTATPTPFLTAVPSVTPRFPPLEGPRQELPTERTNYREDPSYALPDAEDLPPLPDEYSSFAPAADPQCPLGWTVFSRPGEGYRICYPPDWQLEVDGYVTPPVDDRWHSIAFMKKNADGTETAHISVYATTPYARPFLFTADCDQAYNVTLSHEPAAVCPDYPGAPPEVMITAYHLRRGERDYFLQVVPYMQYDESIGGYPYGWSEADLETAFEILDSFELIEEITIAPSPGP